MFVDFIYGCGVFDVFEDGFVVGDCLLFGLGMELEI